MESMFGSPSRAIPRLMRQLMRMCTACAWSSPLILIVVQARILAVLLRCASPKVGSRDGLDLKEIAAVRGVTESQCASCTAS